MLTPIHCAHCKQRLGACFEVTKIDAAGTNKGAVRVCSLKCLINWAYTYGIRRGSEGVTILKTAFQEISKLLKGGKP